MRQIYFNAIKQLQDNVTHFGTQLSKSQDQYEMYYYRKLLLRSIFRLKRIKRRLNDSK